MQDTILEIKNLEKKYHSINDEIVALKNINLKINNGEIIAIVGPSGCGKSTLLSILANLENKSSGEIIYKNHLEYGYMLQNDSLMPWRNILDNCLIGLEIKKINNEYNINYVKSLLKKYGLFDFIEKYPHNLSGGMKQRVALIRTLALKPDILLLDEPYSALDYQTRLSLSDDLYRIIKAEGKTAILITHDIAEAMFLINKPY